LQLHSGHYRNPEQLPDGAVLVVGSGQSGLQIAEELYQNGRSVHLCTGTAPRVPRRYRGKDIVRWLTDIGFFDQTVDKLPSPKAKFAGNPQATGKNGGHSVNLHQFARDGVKLYGHIAGAWDGKVMLAPDLNENLAKVDKAEKDILGMVDRYIEANNIDVPQETVPDLRDGYSAEEISEIDLKSARINTIIWAIGYSFDYNLVKLPVTDGDGFPLQKDGITQYPGLYFVGLHWLRKRKSAILLGVNEDAECIIDDITRRV
jgi:putative flavoprotein involved in K+ transport